MLWNCKLDVKYQERKAQGLVSSAVIEPDDGWVYTSHGCILSEDILRELIQHWPDLVLGTLMDDDLAKILKIFSQELQNDSKNLKEAVSILSGEDSDAIFELTLPIFEKIKLKREGLNDSYLYLQMITSKADLIATLLLPLAG